jgi:glutamate racemase
LKRPIGIFDSGVGGLTVFHEVMRHLPGEDLIYFGDTARVPYGIKSAETVTRYSLEITDFLMKQDIKLVIVACNTASSVAIPALESLFTIPVLGVLVPGVRAALKQTRTRRVGIIGTEATIASGAYVDTIHRLEKGVEVYAKACPLFVPMAEEGWGEHPLTVQVAREYLHDMSKTGIDSLVLGCTHYPILKKAIQEVMGAGVTLIDSALETAWEAQRLLAAKGLLRPENPEPIRKFFVTDARDSFRKIGERFLPHAVTNIERVTL